MNLVGQVALITGVSRDGQIGQAVAGELAREGARVALVARSRERVTARAAEILETGGTAIAIAADVSTEEGVSEAIRKTLAEFGRIDVLVNLAGGLTVYKPAVEHSLRDWWHEVQNNLVSAFLLSQAVFPLMREQGGGVIVNFSRAGLPQANMLAYNCAKAGVDALTRTLALEGREFNIRVNAVAPGLTDTASNIAQMKPKDTTKWASKEHIARTVLFLASDAAAGITGQTVQVAGKGI
jgi:NAD(P)-dependent dehydrogenase (short-subunit alcohol dehydrogenase family)